MRLRVLSDLHLELAPIELPPAVADVVVLAGDIHTKGRGVAWAHRAFPDTPVVYVPGNHEYYGDALPRLTTKLHQAAADTPVHVLDNAQVELGGITFVGCTLWTDFGLFGDPLLASLEAARRMTDYRRIRVSPAYRRLRPTDTRAAHAISRRCLADRLSEPRDGPVVVVTHHAPSPRSLDPATRSDLVSAAYASDLESLVEGGGAALWIHGHIHRACAYEIGATRVLNNPRGYPDEPETGFDAALVVEV